jgi:aspartyl-tRNA(Asn)/glutamyl-tRNA(Gln) amidotransferase subunit A
MPTTALPALELDSLSFAGIADNIFTPTWNAVGLPAMSIPMGFNAGGLPTALQIVGRPFEETTVLQAADAYQRQTDWHLQVPTVKASV